MGGGENLHYYTTNNQQGKMEGGKNLHHCTSNNKTGGKGPKNPKTKLRGKKSKTKKTAVVFRPEP